MVAGPARHVSGMQVAGLRKQPDYVGVLYLRKVPVTGTDGKKRLRL